MAVEISLAPVILRWSLQSILYGMQRLCTPRQILTHPSICTGNAMADRPLDDDVDADVRSFASSSVGGPGGVINPAESRPPVATNDARSIGSNDVVEEPSADTNG